MSDMPPITKQATEKARRLAAQAYPNAHLANDEEAELIAQTLIEKQARCEAVSDEHSIKIIEGCFKVDSKTNRLISYGFVIFDGEATFELKADAFEYLSKNGFECTDFMQAFLAGQDGIIAKCWHEDFINTYNE